MKTPVPEGVCYKDMTPQQKAIVLLWIRLGLPIEVKNVNTDKEYPWTHWNDEATPDIEQHLHCIEAPSKWLIRLKR